MSETQAMPRQSLLEYFRPDSRPSKEIAVVWRRGYRTIRWSYDELLGIATGFKEALRSRGVGKGDRVLLWGENSGEWIAAFLGCLLQGAIVVPMDAIAEKGFARRVAEQAGAKLAIVGHGLSSPLEDSRTLALEELGNLASDRSVREFSPAAMGPDDAIEIVFTSGTTAEPRGVVLTHRNLLANLAPIEKEIARYRRYERFVHPLRFLDLLPLSHVFGQLLGIFLPQIIGGTSVFLDTLNPAEVARAIRDERVSLLVTVPRLIESLRDQIERDLAARDQIEKFRRDYGAAEHEHFLIRWWRFRAIRRRFGWKFWAVISGGAALPAAAEEFWTRLGYAVIQGYGLTETTSLVSLNHPFRLGRGSIGKALPGLDVELSDEGEILVRGENVASGYWKDSGIAPVLDEDGWFHTGDLGERDANGNLYFKGRRKNVIVTPEGLNVYPGDLEAELRKEPEVRDCVVVGLARDGNAEACAVLLLRDSSGTPEHADAAAEAVVRRANERLAPFQQMRRWFVWPDQDFPRTPTQKPILRRIVEVVEAKGGTDGKGPAAAGPLGELLARVLHGRAAQGGGEELNLSSIERVELMGALEDRYQIDLSETEYASADTVQALERLVGQPPPRAAAFQYPRWPQSWPVRIVRAVVFNLLARPAMLILGWPTVRGRDHLRDAKGPVLVVANHVAFFDPAYILEGLPERFRKRLAVAMDGELLESMRTPPRGTGFFKGIVDRVAYFLVVSIYNVFPLPRRAGFRKSFAFAGDLIDRGWNVLVFPEGERARTTRMNPFRAGIGLLATRLGVPVVPMRFDGVAEAREAGKHLVPPGRIKVWIGAPIQYKEGEAAEEIARDLERRVAELGTDSGA
ncbi:MAG TPA: AMP-binding protein [Candidatus Acidoferrales bacterium]|nr:AMP-binding protein [Candidatus Acidoferrales bacterium]